LTVCLLLTAALTLPGCATTAGNIALGAGLGVVGTVSALDCLLTCHDGGHGW
jgi:hypothetical protein